MNRRTFLALAPLPLAAAAAPPEPGFVSLFDGRTLRGWTIQQGPETAFYVDKGDIVVHDGSNFPTWLRSEKQYENFDFRCEFFVKGWCNSGIYLHAPEHGRNTWCGMKINIFQKLDETPLPESVGSIFPLVPPLKTNVKAKGEWNGMRVLMNWPRLKVWINDEPVQDLNLEAAPELRHRLRRGYLGLESLSYPIRFRNLRIQELPGTERWTELDAAGWMVTEGKPKVEWLGETLRVDGLGYLGTKEQYKDFAFQCYMRPSKWSNGGILFHSDGGGDKRHYEIQVHDVEGAVYPTGSLYHYKRSSYPRIEPEEWFLFQLFVKDKWCLVRINGEDVMEYSALENTATGRILLQAHQLGRWIEYKQLRVKTL